MRLIMTRSRSREKSAPALRLSSIRAGHAAWGSDPTAIVDPRLRVNGIQGLRVADASIMPAALNACTHAPTTMIGEKAAAMIAEDARRGVDSVPPSPRGAPDDHLPDRLNAL